MEKRNKNSPLKQREQTDQVFFFFIFSFQCLLFFVSLLQDFFFSYFESLTAERRLLDWIKNKHKEQNPLNHKKNGKKKVAAADMGEGAGKQNKQQKKEKERKKEKKTRRRWWCNELKRECCCCCVFVRVWNYRLWIVEMSSVSLTVDNGFALLSRWSDWWATPPPFPPASTVLIAMPMPIPHPPSATEEGINNK